MSDSSGLGPSALGQPIPGEPSRDVDAVEALAAAPSSGPRRALIIGGALLALVLLPLGLLVHAGWQPLLDLDRTVSDALVVPGRGSDVQVLRVLTAAGVLLARVVLLVPLVVWFGVMRRWQLVVFLVVAGFGVSPVNHRLKAIFDRARPSYDDTFDVGGLSFPSGHSSGAAVLAAVLVVVAWPVLAGAWRTAWIGLAAVGMVVVGYTRIALGAHYLSDVVAGWSFGIAWVLLLAVLLQVWPGQPGSLPRRAAPELR